jgi:hypothetical protein
MNKNITSVKILKIDVVNLFVCLLAKVVGFFVLLTLWRFLFVFN